MQVHVTPTLKPLLGLMELGNDWLMKKFRNIMPFETMYDCWTGANQFYYLGKSTSWGEREKAGLFCRLPILFGVPLLEKLAPPVAPFLVGRTGSQLFLTDGKPKKLPLLLRMTSDCEDGKFLSALGAFRCRIVYANVSYDHMVGWRTSSIRRETELVKPPLRSLDGYKHVVDVEYCPSVSSDGPRFPPEAIKAKEAAQNAPNAQNTTEYHECMEEEMIRGLQKLAWKKVDVSFPFGILALLCSQQHTCKK
ncbi:hypothetical protein SLEP1_g6077 [Rubroshorea leprosula]|uniref:DUF676 domain-containing protein n=1 Tax=Rubroshorea leprosula TaxID=152421 RepID=A0AAV5HYF8_9ROSI|nr:hypothetical protein SLEP1_g6077 [Rubroshorea leprosula]